MDLDNPIKIVVHHLLIGGMTCLDRHDEFLMVSALILKKKVMIKNIIYYNQIFKNKFLYLILEIKILK